MKSDSTKENKSLKIPGSNSIKEHPKKLNGFKSSLSREKFDKFVIDIAKDCPVSDVRVKEKKKLRKKKSRNHINLVEPCRRRDDKSVVRLLVEKDRSPGGQLKKSGASLKRIKSSTALQTVIKKYK